MDRAVAKGRNGPQGAALGGIDHAAKGGVGMVSAIETSSLTRYYGALCAVDHLDLSVKQGELLAFLGPNGAGKTTTIRLLTGLIRPNEGTAQVAGYDIGENATAVKRQVGVVPQRSNLYAEMSARQNLVFCCQLYGLPRAVWRQRSDELLATFELSDRADTAFGALSGGMKRRLTIAAALVHRPRVLFLDEPTMGLDVRSARHLRAMIARLRSEGVTIFLTTHMIPEAEALADRVAIIVKGALAVVDTPEALRARCAQEAAIEVRFERTREVMVTALRRARGIRSVSRSGEALHVAVDSVDEGLRVIQQTADGEGARIAQVRTVVPTLEDAFVHITNLDSEVMRIGGTPGGKRR